MPIFEYRCDSCGNQFEKLVRRDTEVECPQCSSHELQQQHSTFAAHANGSPKQSAMPSCPGGMCQTPGICGRN
ncbi:MAG: zinc ribbon domain-containing protein [Candidatus Solibacter usitatus]|nr:zinc ribbon domain-containing protein [Candidatus Solibacter usitatus]